MWWVAEARFDSLRVRASLADKAVVVCRPYVLSLMVGAVGVGIFYDVSNVGIRRNVLDFI